MKINEFIDAFENDKLSKDDLNFIINTFDYDTIHYLSCANLSENFIETFIDKLNLSDIIKRNNVSESFLEKHINKLDGHLWTIISTHMNLSDSFIDKYKNKLNWDKMCEVKILPEAILKKHSRFLDWHEISINQRLSISFIKKFEKKLDWYFLSDNQYLSEELIHKHADEVNWTNVTCYQDISEEFIENHKNNINWEYIAYYQTLSEPFIEKYQHLLDLETVMQFQKLSEPFIERFYSDNLASIIIEHQVLSDDFYKKHNLNKYNDTWIDKSIEFKKDYIINTGVYECYDDYFIAYKGIRKDNYSCMHFKYRYFKGNIYESKCDCTEVENSYGLSAWTLEQAKVYCDEKIIKVKIKYEDVGRCIKNINKIRCFKLEVLEEIE